MNLGTDDHVSVTVTEGSKRVNRLLYAMNTVNQLLSQGCDGQYWYPLSESGSRMDHR
jgi:hypothetical protein